MREQDIVVTDEMLQAGMDCIVCDNEAGVSSYTIETIYRAMAAASPGPHVTVNNTQPDKTRVSVKRIEAGHVEVTVEPLEAGQILSARG